MIPQRVGCIRPVLNGFNFLFLFAFRGAKGSRLRRRWHGTAQHYYGWMSMALYAVWKDDLIYTAMLFRWLDGWS
jgi:hypothetical protein